MASNGLSAKVPDREEARKARRLSQELAPLVKEGIRARYTSDGCQGELPLTPLMLRLFLRVLEEMAQGNAVTIVPVHAELTTQQAADLLGVSRPFLIKLIERGEIPCRLVGTHRRVRFEDLTSYRERQAEVRRKALDELSAIGQELDLQD